MIDQHIVAAAATTNSQCPCSELTAVEGRAHMLVIRPVQLAAQVHRALADSPGLRQRIQSVQQGAVLVGHLRQALRPGMCCLMQPNLLQTAGPEDVYLPNFG